ncbi:galacturonosyltransferase 11 [Spatholobus suberectus]|nr:galacturonosyltransferase 11 [Spatholobus suberectus]
MKSHTQALECANAATVQSTVFAQISAEALPKSLHCLNVKLTADWLEIPCKNSHMRGETSPGSQITIYIISAFFQMATFVVVNSTVINAAIQNRATFEVQNIEEFHWLNESYSPIVKQLHTPESRPFYFGPYQGVNVEPKLQNPKFLSSLYHLRFNIPEIKLSFLYTATTGRNMDEVLRVRKSLQKASKFKVATQTNWKQVLRSGFRNYVYPLRHNQAAEASRKDYPNEGWQGCV